MSTTGNISPKIGSPERLAEEVSLEVLRTAFALEHFLVEGLKQYGLTMTQYNVLRILRGAGKEGLCRNDVGARMLSPVPDATRLIDRLIAAGYAEKEKSNTDRRYTTTRITGKGMKLLAELDQPVLDLHQSQFGHLSATQMHQLTTLLQAARNRP